MLSHDLRVSVKSLTSPLDRPLNISLQTLSFLISYFLYMDLKQHQVSNEKFSSEYLLKQALIAATVDLLQLFSDNPSNYLSPAEEKGSLFSCYLNTWEQVVIY